MQCVGVSIAEDGECAQPFRARGADDAAGDLAAVSDENGIKARAHKRRQAGARLARKAAIPSRPSGPRRASAKLFAAASI